MKSTFTDGIANVRGIFGAPDMHEGAYGSVPVPDSLQYDSTTKFFFCTDINGVPHAYCEILGFTTWYVFETNSNGLSYFYGIYRIIFTE